MKKVKQRVGNAKRARTGSGMEVILLNGKAYPFGGAMESAWKETKKDETFLYGFISTSVDNGFVYGDEIVHVTGYML